MSSITRSRPHASAGRFGRPAATAKRRPSAHGRMSRRKQSKGSSMGELLSSLTGALAGMGSAKKRSGGKSAGGKRAGRLALLAGGLGVAVKNRQRLTQMVKQRRASSNEPQGPAPVA